VKQLINGFSNFSRSEKLDCLKKEARLSDESMKVLDDHLHREENIQEIYADFSENTVSNFYLPLGLAPNFMINGKLMILPMVIEESSVVAAASNAAKFWAVHGGFHARVTGDSKVGQVHFTWSGDPGELYRIFENKRMEILHALSALTQRMEQRGGGIKSMEIRKTDPVLHEHYQLFVHFNTADAMGANFINSVLEELAPHLSQMMEESEATGELEVLMSILSNYTPESLVQCYVEGGIEIFEHLSPGLSALQFAQKFKKAVDIAIHDPYRAVTHNKGIFNGMDAVILATGNDYRAVEAAGHAYASRDGRYKSLSLVELSESSFRFSLEVPMAVGSVGGLTGNHPMAATSLEILGKPSAFTLMEVIAAAGLATNFSALRSLISSGIQQGHMRMHLGNILRQLNASEAERDKLIQYFAGRPISYAGVAGYLDFVRKQTLSE
jgi:hydroxymethylglutaryl-CoA reductase